MFHGKILEGYTLRSDHCRTLLIDFEDFITPGKISIELKHHPIEKENHLNQTSMTLGSKC